MAIVAKPKLRALLLRLNMRRLADAVVPDVQGTVKLMAVKMSKMESFMNKQARVLLISLLDARWVINPIIIIIIIIVIIVIVIVIVVIMHHQRHSVYYSIIVITIIINVARCSCGYVLIDDQHKCRDG